MGEREGGREREREGERHREIEREREKERERESRCITITNISYTPSINDHTVINCPKLNPSPLLPQSPDMQWSYDVRGVIPEYSPPQGRSSIPPKGPLPDPHRHLSRNFVIENLRLTTTAVSSPVKGAPLVGAK